MGVERSSLAFDTVRLSLRALRSAADLGAEEDALRALLTPDVLAPLPPPLQAVSTPLDWLNARLDESDVLSVSHDGALIGLVLLVRFDQEAHIGYLFAQRAWGKGFATEMLCALGPELVKGGVTRVLAGVSKDNAASARVLLKAGFILSPTPAGDGTPLYQWSQMDQG